MWEVEEEIKGERAGRGGRYKRKKYKQKRKVRKWDLKKEGGAWERRR